MRRSAIRVQAMGGGSGGTWFRLSKRSARETTAEQDASACGTDVAGNTSAIDDAKQKAQSTQLAVSCAWALAQAVSAPARGANKSATGAGAAAGATCEPDA